MNRAKIRLAAWNTLLILVLLLMLTRSGLDTTDPVEQVRAYTRWEEFDYVAWTIDALGLKTAQGSLDLVRYLNQAQQHQIVIDYVKLIQRLEQVQNDIANIYADPAVKDKAAAAAHLLAEQNQLESAASRQGALAESVLQHQISVVVAEIGLDLGGQPFPPLLYHVTPLPLALIVSPRSSIRQDADISLLPDLNLSKIDQLENRVSSGLDVSALVVPVGGIGIYPTMVESTSDLTWQVQTVSHEWMHNYLTLHPLGALYYESPELRTINETTSDISGTEVGTAVLRRFYPEYSPPPPAPVPQEELTPPKPGPAGTRFNFNAEMHTTRVHVDELLAAGKIQEAEQYMETRRQFFWDHGYRIRKLNQAYFAFYGAYAETPGGAAGIDPVGAAVRILRAESPTFADFIRRIQWVTSFEALQRLIQPKAANP